MAGGGTILRVRHLVERSLLMNQFLDILLLASFVIGGVYSLWTAVQMRRWKELKPNKFIYPNGCEPGDCTNPEGVPGFYEATGAALWPPCAWPRRQPSWQGPI